MLHIPAWVAGSSGDTTMPEALPSVLKLEVKISRATKHSLSDRDLSGIAPDGFAAILISSRVLHGPRWLLVPARHLQAGNHDETDLCTLVDGGHPALCQGLDRIWSDWLLDDTVWAKLFQQDHMKIKPAIDWCLQHHPPRRNKSQGNLREGRLADALQRFREELDRRHDENSAQQEGFIHQYLLAYGLEKLGYNATVNPVGVPDIAAVLLSETARSSCANTRQKLKEWNPVDADQKSLREFLLRQPEAALTALRDIWS